MHKDKRYKATTSWLKKHNVTIYPIGKNNSPKFVVKSEFYSVYNAWCKGTISIQKESPVNDDNQNHQKQSEIKMDKIELKEKQAYIGLFLRCKCKKEYKHEGLVNCGCTKFKYKARIHIPGTKNEELKPILKSTNYNDAVIELTNLKNELIKSINSGVFAESRNNAPQKSKLFYEEEIQNREANPKISKNNLLLIEAIRNYVNNLYDTEDRVLSRENNQEAERFFKYAIRALEESGIQTRTLRFEDVNKPMMRIIKAYFKNRIKMSPPYYNKALGRMSSLWNYTIIDNCLTSCVNIFDKQMAPRMKYFHNPTAFPLEKFEELLKVVTYENGWKYIRKKNRNLYKSYLKDLFKVALYTGGRRAVVVGLKWSHIKFKNGKPSYIEFEAKKENLAKQISIDKYKKRFTLTLYLEILEFLIEKGLYEKRGKNGEIKNEDYVLAPNEGREKLMRLLTDSFPHFYSKLGTDDKFNFKHLRKTYITETKVKQIATPTIKLETGHAENSRVIKEAYEDKRVIASVNAGKSLFSKSSSAFDN